MRPRSALMLMAVVGLVCSMEPVASAGGRWGQWRNSLKPHGPSGRELTLAVHGRTDYVIVIPTDAATQEQKAAEDLAHWLHEMTGANFPVVDDGTARQPREIRIGFAPRDGLGDDGYQIAVQDERLLLLGGRKRGPINAVYALLEEDLGCRFYTRTVNRIPRRPTVRLKPVLRSYVPPLQIRDPFYRDAFDGTWSLRNRTNAPSARVPEEWGGNMDYALFVHTFNTLVPPSKYFEQRPELFMQNADGKRTPRQLCLTEPETIRIATESVLRILKERPDSEIISVSKNDGGGSCVCERCKAIDDAEGSKAGSLIHFVNKVAEAVEKEHPEVMVSTLAYLETTKPPATIRPRHNVAIQLCTDRAMWSHPFTPAEQSPEFSEAIEGWAAIGAPIHIWDYVVNFSHYVAPMPNMDVIAENIRYFVDHNAAGVMTQGAYQSPGSEFEAMRCWVIAKLLWDPSRDLSDLMNDFIWGYYGEAARFIAKYNDLLYRTAEKHRESLAAPKGGIRYPMDSEFLSEEFLSEATALFERAEALAENEEILRRVQLAGLPILYVQVCRGPEFVGTAYLELLERFEAIARREKITHLQEGPPDLDRKLKAWREAAQVHEALNRVDRDDVTVWSLPSAWRFAPDLKDVGVAERWFGVEFDDSAWPEVRSDTGTGWESQGFPDYTGLGWYRQVVEVPADIKREHVYLHFGAVDEDAYVYLNGELAFEHTCASTGLRPEVIWVTPFSFEPGPGLKLGQMNTLAVRVLNRIGMGGVYKPVYLVTSKQPLFPGLIRRIVEDWEQAR